MYNFFIPYSNSTKIWLLLFGYRYQTPKKIYPAKNLFRKKQPKYFVPRKHGKR